MIHHTPEKTSIKQKKRTCYLFLEGSSEGSKAFECKIDRYICCPCVWHRPCQHLIAGSGECPEFDGRWSGGCGSLVVASGEHPLF